MLMLHGGSPAARAEGLQLGQQRIKHHCTHGLRPNAQGMGGTDVTDASCSYRNETPYYRVMLPLLFSLFFRLSSAFYYHSLSLLETPSRGPWVLILVAVSTPSVPSPPAAGGACPSPALTVK